MVGWGSNDAEGNYRAPGRLLFVAFLAVFAMTPDALRRAVLDWGAQASPGSTMGMGWFYVAYRLKR